MWLLVLRVSIKDEIIISVKQMIDPLKQWRYTLNIENSALKTVTKELQQEKENKILYNKNAL